MQYIVCVHAGRCVYWYGRVEAATVAEARKAALDRADFSGRIKDDGPVTMDVYDTEETLILDDGEGR